jgi:hypothetical protein
MGRVAGWRQSDLSVYYKEYVIYRALMDCYDHAVHLLEYFIPAKCRSTSLMTHAVRCGVVVDYHANCKGTHLAIPYPLFIPPHGVDTTLRKIAGELSEKPFYPLTSTCCAFAGDSGLLHEELTRSATREEAGEVAGKNLYLCANRNCEVGMEQATHAPYESFVYALEELTRER